MIDGGGAQKPDTGGEGEPPADAVGSVDLPSSRPPESQSRRTGQQIDESLGILRDAIAALRNLETLLRSPRVGPRALAGIVPQHRDLCAPVQGALGIVLEHLAAHAALTEVVASLREYAPLPCGRLKDALDRASGAELGARGRLALESEIGVGAAELNAMHQLVQLLRTAVEAPTTELDLNAVVAESFAASRPSGPPGTGSVTAHLVAPDEECGLVANAKVVTALIPIAVAIVAKATGAAPSIVTSCGADDVVLTVSAAPADGDALLVYPPAIVGPTAACAAVAAAAQGGEFRVEAGGQTVVMRWKAG